MPLKIYDPAPLPKQGFLHSKTNILAVAAGKGGVGKSTVTVNLAFALKRMGFSVGIMDTDIYGPSIRKMLPEDRLPNHKEGAIVPALCSGIRVISMAYFRNENEAAVVRAPIANALISQFIKQVEWGHLDYLLIDFPPGTGDVQLTICQQANLTGALLVTTPQEVAVMDVKKAMNMFDQVRIPIVGIVENMSYYFHTSTQERVHLFGKGGGERLAREGGVPFLGSLPIDESLCKSGDTGQSLFFNDIKGETAIVKAFISCAERTIVHLKALKEEEKGCLQNFEYIWKEM